MFLQGHRLGVSFCLPDTPPACWAPRGSGLWNPKSCILSVACSWNTILGAQLSTCLLVDCQVGPLPGFPPG